MQPPPPISARRLAIDATAMLAAGVVLAMLGPFGTYGAPFAIRLVYWIGLLLAGYGLFLPAAILASRAAKRLDLPDAAMWAAASLTASVPMTLVVWLANGVWSTLPPLSLESAVALYGNVLVVGGGVTGLFWFARGRHLRAAIGAETPTPVTPDSMPEPAAPSARFLDRLPPHLGADLLALEMEDHYVRAHTALGSTLVLMRLCDAIEELDGITGAQVHRSWWVSRSAVASARRDGRNYRLILTNGIEAPVARNNLPALQDAGWL